MVLSYSHGAWGPSMGTEVTALEWIAAAGATGLRVAMLRKVGYAAGSAGLFQEVAIQRHRALSALDYLRVGVILLDGACKPAYLDRAAPRLAERLCLDGPSAGYMS